MKLPYKTDRYKKEPAYISKLVIFKLQFLGSGKELEEFLLQKKNKK